MEPLRAGDGGRNSTPRRIFGRTFLALLLLAGWGCAASDHYLSGRSFYEQGNYDRAVAEAKEAVEVDPDDGSAWTLLGMADAKKGSYKEAVQSFEKALALGFRGSMAPGAEGSFNSPWYWLGYAYYHEGQLDEAIAAFKKAVETRGDLAASYEWWSGSSLRKGDYDTAIDAATKGLALTDPVGRSWHPYYLRNRSLCSFVSAAVGDTRRAETLLTKVKEVEKDYDPEGHSMILYLITEDEGTLKEISGRGWLGVETESYSKGAVQGVRLTEVVENGPAARSGLRRGDIIIRLGGKAVKNGGEFKPSSFAAGSSVDAEIVRGQERRRLTITMGSRAERASVEGVLTSAPVWEPFVNTCRERRLVLQAVDAAEKNGDYGQALQVCLDYLRERRDFLVTKRAIEVEQRLDPPPVISAEAKEQAVLAQKGVTEATDEKSLARAIEEYREAIRLAPWWAELHLNLALALERHGDYRSAAKSLELFQLARPHAPEAGEITAKVHELKSKAGNGEND
ncbi:MAG: tetratricopeptide repeat protein [Deltaproteobacteria bacterium]|nr:tetratricopeptide repeat protein [Deltaproteobacteria bacterium]